MHVMIVDDSATARMFVRKCLEIAGFPEADFEEAADGAEALEAMKARRPDLLVTDLTMPGMDGVELLTALSASPRLHGVPTIVVSSRTDPKTEEEVMQLGAGRLLGKPLSPSDVAEAVSCLSLEENDADA